MRVISLNHVALHVADVKTSVRFYRDVLGLPEIPRPRSFTFPGAWLQLGTHGELHLIGDAKPGSFETHDSSRGRHWALEVVDMGEVVERLRGLCQTFRGPGDRGDGALQVYVTDPDGYIVELCQLPRDKS